MNIRQHLDRMLLRLLSKDSQAAIEEFLEGDLEHRLKWIAKENGVIENAPFQSHHQHSNLIMTDLSLSGPPAGAFR